MNFSVKKIVSVGIFGCWCAFCAGCSGVNVSGTVSPAEFFVPGLINTAPAPAELPYRACSWVNQLAEAK